MTHSSSNDFGSDNNHNSSSGRTHGQKNNRWQWSLGGQAKNSDLEPRPRKAPKKLRWLCNGYATDIEVQVYQGIQISRFPCPGFLDKHAQDSRPSFTEIPINSIAYYDYYSNRFALAISIHSLLGQSRPRNMPL